MGTWIWWSSCAVASHTTARTALPVPVRAAARVLTADGGNCDKDAGAALTNAVRTEGRVLTPTASEPSAREMRTFDGTEGGENRYERKGKAVPSNRKISARDGDGTGPRKRLRGRSTCDTSTQYGHAEGAYIQRGAMCKKTSGAGHTLYHHKGCTTTTKAGGVCIKHQAKRKHRACSHDGCSNNAQIGGVCIKHGAKVKACSHNGCTKTIQVGGVCLGHGAKLKGCSHNGCTNNARGKEGVCIWHGTKCKVCSYD